MLVDGRGPANNARPPAAALVLGRDPDTGALAAMNGAGDVWGLFCTVKAVELLAEGTTEGVSGLRASGIDPLGEAVATAEPEPEPEPEPARIKRPRCANGTPGPL